LRAASDRKLSDILLVPTPQTSAEAVSWHPATARAKSHASIPNAHAHIKAGYVWTLLAGTADQDIQHEQKTLIHLPQVGDRETSGRYHGGSGFTLPNFAGTLAQLVRRIEYIFPDRFHLLASKPQSLP